MSDGPATEVREYVKEQVNASIAVCRQSSEVRSVGVKESLEKISGKLEDIEKTLCTGEGALVTRVEVQDVLIDKLDKKADDTKEYAIAISGRMWIAVATTVGSLFSLLATIAVAIAIYLLNKP
jgi:hypothetical protein